MNPRQGQAFCIAQEVYRQKAGESIVPFGGLSAAFVFHNSFTRKDLAKSILAEYDL